MLHLERSSPRPRLALWHLVHVRWEAAAELRSGAVNQQISRGTRQVLYGTVRLTHGAGKDRSLQTNGVFFVLYCTRSAQITRLIDVCPSFWQKSQSPVRLGRRFLLGQLYFHFHSIFVNGNQQVETRMLLLTSVPSLANRSIFRRCPCGHAIPNQMPSGVTDPLTQ